ncbi:MAG: restriction endonuclease subunit S [Leptolyngbyaceae cyanobacterium bins.349]|nr:restriction endonuclease subunit S [Leptolyngbyaceae cyanobacterium bins.349]
MTTVEVAQKFFQEFPTYPKYKDLDIGWIIKIPSHWKFKRLKHIVGNSNVKFSDKPENLPYVGLENIESKTGRLLLENPVEEVESTVSLFQKGDLLFGKLRPYLAKVAYPNFSGVCTTELLILKPSHNSYGKFLCYQLLADGFIDLVNSLTYGTKMPRVNAEQVCDLVVPLPPLEEQKSIAHFLDQATAEIDQIIDQQQQLIALLEEERTTVISHAVTKGLDPSVPMKDSGVEWLGEIPQHWEIGRLKYFWKVVDCKHRTAEYFREGIPIVSTTEVKPGRLSLESTRLTSYQEFLDLSDGDRLPKKGDIIYSRNASVGSAAYVDTDQPFCMGQDVCLITSQQKNQLFLTYLLNSPIILSQLDSLRVGSTITRINVGQIQGFIVVCPDENEQTVIADYLDTETARIDEAIANVKDQIAKLEEYRTALISDGVTGKIDVRDWDT